MCQSPRRGTGSHPYNRSPGERRVGKTPEDESARCVSRSPSAFHQPLALLQPSPVARAIGRLHGTPYVKKRIVCGSQTPKWHQAIVRERRYS